MVELKHIDPLSLGKVQGLMMAVFGLIIGILVALLGGFAALVPGVSPQAVLGLGVFSIIVFPILYGIVGLISGIIAAFIYNFIAKKVGGVKITLK